MRRRMPPQMMIRRARAMMKRARAMGRGRKPGRRLMAGTPEHAERLMSYGADLWPDYGDIYDGFEDDIYDGFEDDIYDGFEDDIQYWRDAG